MHRGDRVVELDNSQFTSGLDAKRTSVAQADQELQQKDAEGEADILQKKLDVETKQADYEKTKLDAAIPKEVVAARDYEDRQIRFSGQRYSNRTRFPACALTWLISATSTKPCNTLVRKTTWTVDSRKDSDQFGRGIRGHQLAGRNPQHGFQ